MKIVRKVINCINSMKSKRRRTRRDAKKKFRELWEKYFIVENKYMYIVNFKVCFENENDIKYGINPIYLGINEDSGDLWVRYSFDIYESDYDGTPLEKSGFIKEKNLKDIKEKIDICNYEGIVEKTHIYYDNEIRKLSVKILKVEEIDDYERNLPIKNYLVVCKKERYLDSGGKIVNFKKMKEDIIHINGEKNIKIFTEEKEIITDWNEDGNPEDGYTKRLYMKIDLELSLVEQLCNEEKREELRKKQGEGEDRYFCFEIIKDPPKYTHEYMIYEMHGLLSYQTPSPI